jgi:coenzyme F420 hydrogenase subunit beta
MEKEGNIVDLLSEVVYNDLCCYCGACGAFCPDFISYEEGVVTAKERCDEQVGTCYHVCPRTHLDPVEMDRTIFGKKRKDRELGYYTDIFTAKSSIKGQDGGVVSALLIHALEEGIIDAAIVTTADKNWQPRAAIATTRDEITAAAGSKYTPAPAVFAYKEAYQKGYKKIGFAGLPCQIEGLRKIQFSQKYTLEQQRIGINIGVFCSEVFHHDRLETRLKEEGVNIEDVEKFDINKGRLYVTAGGGEHEISLKDLADCVREGCRICYNFASEYSDISVGSIGSKEGWSTVIIRTPDGKRLFKSAVNAGIIEARALDEKNIKKIQKLAARKKEENLKSLLKQSEPLKLANLVLDAREIKHVL